MAYHQGFTPKHPYACGLNLAGNVGHQNALMAGLNAVKERCDVAISIDADLQDDVNAIPEMLERYREDVTLFMVYAGNVKPTLSSNVPLPSLSTS